MILLTTKTNVIWIDNHVSSLYLMLICYIKMHQDADYRLVICVCVCIRIEIEEKYEKIALQGYQNHFSQSLWSNAILAEGYEYTWFPSTNEDCNETGDVLDETIDTSRQRVLE